MADTAMSDNIPSTTSTVSAVMQRETLNGTWILDKSRGNWSMRGYLETMYVNELAIKAHEKGEQEHETIHTISLDTNKVRIIKRSRVNNDIEIELELGKELVTIVPPGDRAKKSLAVSNNMQHLQITSSLQTVNGKAYVTDIKKIEEQQQPMETTDTPPSTTTKMPTTMIQSLTIVNEQTGKSCTTTRYFIPHPDSDVNNHIMPEHNTGIISNADNDDKMDTSGSNENNSTPVVQKG